MRISYNQYFMILAKMAALRSSCNSRPSGAVIVKNNRVLTTGMSGTVKGTFQCSDKGKTYCYRRDNKLPDMAKSSECLSIHSEENAISQAAEMGIAITGAEIYCTLQPCIICLKRIASVNIKKVYFELPYESLKTDRDKSWLLKFKEFNIEYEILTLDNNSIDLAVKELYFLTSRRRLDATE